MKWPPATTISRLVSVPVVLGAGAVLALALYLDPSPLGHSTHTQLGLNTCTFLALTGQPCPMCGMTTTFSLMAHLQPLQALVNQPFGVVLFSMTAFVFGTSAAEVILPRDRWRRLGRFLAPYEGTLATIFLIGMGVGWVYKMVMMHFFPGV